MKMAIFLKMLLRISKPTLVIVGVILYCSIPVYAGSPKAFDKYNPPSDLILTLPDQGLTQDKITPSISPNLIAHDNNETQTSALKSPPVNVNCNMDIIQNTVGDVPLSNRLFGKCGLQYHY